MSSNKEIPLSVNESTFIRSALQGGLRVDGRSVSDYRSLRIDFPGGSGRVQIELGRTRVIAVTTADLITPNPDRPNEGVLNIFVNYSSMASTAFEAGYQGEQGVSIGRIIDRGLRESRAIDTESLCILAGEKVWSIRVDIHVVDHDGNMLDAINMATVCALLHFRRPDVTVVGETVTVHSVDDRQPIALALHHIPIACSFAFFDQDGTSSTSSTTQPLYLVDPDLKEELVSDATLTVTLNIHGEICCLQKSGGVGVDMALILQCTQIALTKTQEITALIQMRLKEEAAKQNTGNVVREPRPLIQPPTKPPEATKLNVDSATLTSAAVVKPIEIHVNPNNHESPDEDEDDASEMDQDGNEGKQDDDDDEDSDDAMDQDANEEEFNQVAKKLQASPTPITANSKQQSIPAGTQRKK